MPHAIRRLLSLLPLLLPLLATAAPREAMTSSTPTAPGVPVSIELWNAEPKAQLSVTLTNARFLSVAPGGGAAPTWLDSVTIDGPRLTLQLPADAVPKDGYTTLNFRAFVELGHNSGGQVELEQPLVFVMRSPYGTVIQQSGNFGLEIPSGPPTCVIAGCGAQQTCPLDSQSQTRGCYQYFGTNYCCLINPFPN